MIKLLAYILAYLLRLRFFFRKFNIGYSRTDLVLDIGSGNDPHPRADILLDFKFSDLDRPFKLVMNGRPFLIGNVEALPFKDKAIDFIICSHVLEHIDNPSKAVEEIVRIGKRGYIEAPSEYIQKLYDVPTHKWFIKQEGNKLIFRRKKKPFYDVDLTLALFKLWNEKNPYHRIWSYAFEEGLIKYSWRDRIDYEVFDLPEAEIDKKCFEGAIKYSIDIPHPTDTGIRVYIKKIIKYYYSLTTSRKRRLKRLSYVLSKR